MGSDQAPPGVSDSNQLDQSTGISPPPLWRSCQFDCNNKEIAESNFSEARMRLLATFTRAQRLKGASEEGEEHSGGGEDRLESPGA